MDELEDCIRKGLIRKMEPSVEGAISSLEMANEWLDEAKRALKNDALRASYSSVYLCFFHSARAVLYKEGYREKSHYCLGAFLKDLSEKGLLENKWYRLFDHMRNSRHNEQYSFSPRPTIEEIEGCINDAKCFLDRMGTLIARSDISK